MERRYAGGPALNAATSPALIAPLAYSTNADEAQESSYIFPASHPLGEQCWIPASSVEETNSVLSSIITDKTLLYQRKVIPVAFNLLRDLEAGRDEYLTTISIIRQNWEASGKLITPQVAKSISAARDALRGRIRISYRGSGYMAKAYNIYRHGSVENYMARNSEKIKEMMSAGKYEDVIQGAFKGDPVANKVGAIAKASMPVAKALRIGGYIATGVEIPYRAYQLYNSKNDNDAQTALGNLVSSSVSGGFAVACVVAGIETAGLAFLACGMAPFFFSFAAGEAAEVIYNQVK